MLHFRAAHCECLIILCEILIQEMNVTFGRIQFYLQIARWKLRSSFVMGILKDLHISS
jgi:hypothetical protein